ncbi:MAG: glyoxalase-like domain protein [Calditrichaeota bacterium]|nr:MAG: glyoxalase-like domain protein [Calditrichota bacterium]
MELDHIFVCVEPGAQQAEILKKFGLTEGPPNQHHGQGTANRRFFFKNAYLELLFLQDSIEIQNELTKPTKLYERFSYDKNKVSPFGVGFRPTTDSEGQAPFPVWPYKPLYLPDALQIDIGYAPLNEPMWFFLAFASRPDQSIKSIRQSLVHPQGFGEITSLKITFPKFSKLSEPALFATSLDGIEIIMGNENLVKIGFDHEHSNQSYDFRPELPLVFGW